MAHPAVSPGEGPGTVRPLNQEQRADKQTTKRSSRKKTKREVPTASRPECVMIAGEGSCPEWQELLIQYPLIDSVQREDFPEHGVSFAYLAHFYRTGNHAAEGSRAQEEFERFFHAIGFESDSANNFESRWFEGIGVQITQDNGPVPTPRKKRAA